MHSEAYVEWSQGFLLCCIDTQEDSKPQRLIYVAFRNQIVQSRLHCMLDATEETCNVVGHWSLEISPIPSNIRETLSDSGTRHSSDRRYQDLSKMCTNYEDDCIVASH